MADENKRERFTAVCARFARALKKAKEPVRAEARAAFDAARAAADVQKGEKLIFDPAKLCETFREKLPASLAVDGAELVRAIEAELSYRGAGWANGRTGDGTPYVVDATARYAFSA